VGHFMRAASGLWALLALSVTPAMAADLAAPSPAPLPVLSAPAPRPLWELRLGGSAQDLSGPESGSFSVTGEVLSPKLFVLNDPVANLFIPRAHVGGSANLNGDTSFAYAGLTWTLDITQQIFIEGSLGGAIHNGNTERVPTIRDEAALGCSPLFRESASLGYRFTPSWSVMATVEHLSNGGACSQNRGLTNVGLRLGYTF